MKPRTAFNRQHDFWTADAESPKYEESSSDNKQNIIHDFRVEKFKEFDVHNSHSGHDAVISKSNKHSAQHSTIVGSSRPSANVTRVQTSRWATDRLIVHCVICFCKLPFSAV
jgi:hypothetical protein